MATLTELDQRLRELGYDLTSTCDGRRTYTRVWRDRKNQEYVISQTVDTKSALIVLTRSQPVNTEELPMAKKTKPAPAASASVTPAPVKRTVKVKKSDVPATTNAVVRPSMRFKELILAGGLSDDEIFAKVQQEFGLDDSKRSYVRWYRNDLKKKGVLK